MVDCSRTYPSNATRVLAMDLFELAWSFHDAKCSEVRYAVLVAMATSVSLAPIEVVMMVSGFDGSRGSLHGWMSFLERSSSGDADANCRSIASLILMTITETSQNPMIERMR